LHLLLRPLPSASAAPAAGQVRPRDKRSARRRHRLPQSARRPARHARGHRPDAAFQPLLPRPARLRGHRLEAVGQRHSMSGRRLQTLTTDALSTMRGVAAMLRWSAQREDVAVALASFRTHAMRAHAEDTSAYELTLANASSADVAAHVLIDLYRRDDASHPQ